MSPSRVHNYHGNNQDDTSINQTHRTRSHHRHHHQPPHHYEALHTRGLLHQQAVLSGVHCARVVPPEGTPPPPWRPLPPIPWSGSGTDTETLSSTSDVESYPSYTEEPPSRFTQAGVCSCYCHRRGLPPCYTCCERGSSQTPSEGGTTTFSCSGESLYTLPYTIPYTCHTSKSSGNSTLDVRLPKNKSKVKFQPTVHTINKQLATENADSDQFWWLANLEENLAWGVFVFHLGVIPFLLIYSGRSGYCFILPLFVIFCGWVVVRRCGRKVHPCQTLGKLILSTSCLLLAITMAEFMNYHMPKETGAAIAISIVILTAFPMGYLICKKDEISC